MRKRAGSACRSIDRSPLFRPLSACCFRLCHHLLYIEEPPGERQGGVGSIARRCAGMCLDGRIIKRALRQTNPQALFCPSGRARTAAVSRACGPRSDRVRVIFQPAVRRAFSDKNHRPTDHELASGRKPERRSSRVSLKPTTIPGWLPSLLPLPSPPLPPPPPLYCTSLWLFRWFWLVKRIRDMKQTKAEAKTSE